MVEYVAKQNGLKLTHIPYNTAAFADIIAGRVPMGSFTWGAALGQIQGGTLRALAVTTEARRPEAPNVPTFKELGYDLVASTWFSLSGPKGLPKEIVQRLNREIIRILDVARDQEARHPGRLRSQAVDAGATRGIHADRNRALDADRAEPQ